MKTLKICLAIAASSVVTATALGAGAVAQDQLRNLNQERRIEQGLRSGTLTTKEAGQLEREEQRVDRMEAQDLKNGSLSGTEQRQINAAENKVSRDILDEKTDAQHGNPTSPSSERMQSDVMRDVKEQHRIQNGLDNGPLTNSEAGTLELRQAHIDRDEASAAANGEMRAAEQQRIRNAEDQESKDIFRMKHNDATN
jgi:hypothetical protein